MDFLKILHVEPENYGIGSGSKWIKSTGEKIDSFSPVDGKLIGSVTAADKDSYEKIIRTAEDAFKKMGVTEKYDKFRSSCDEGQHWFINTPAVGKAV